MITIPTTLVLGAGASAEFNFPLGASLITSVLAATHPNVAGGEAIDVLLGLDYSRGDLTRFHRALANSGAESIDAFLEHRQDLADIGKAAIATMLIASEQPHFLADYSKPSWYRYLFQQMLAPWTKFGENKLAIITYNYDRSLDHFLKTAVREQFRRDDDQVREKLGSFPILHLHGDLGSIWPTDKGYRPYERDLSVANVAIAQQRIRVIHEDVDAIPIFQEARQLLSQSQRICFLGFGFHAVNVARLHLATNNPASFYASVFGMTTPEVNAAARLLPRFDFHEDTTVLPYLRRSGVLLP